jgi:mono/diheme cytochrome c family protein
MERQRHPGLRPPKGYGPGSFRHHSRIALRSIRATAAVALVLAGTAASAQTAHDFTAAQVAIGADIYERNCSPCHGPRMLDPQSAFNLRNFPADQYDRFVASVTRGRNQMPPWGDMLKPDEIEALWAYVLTGER